MINLFFLVMFQSLLRTIEYPNLEGRLPNNWMNMPESIVQWLLKLWQPWCCDHFLSLLSEEPFPNVQPNLLSMECNLCTIGVWDWTSLHYNMILKTQCFSLKYYYLSMHPYTFQLQLVPLYSMFFHRLNAEEEKDILENWMCIFRKNNSL